MFVFAIIFSIIIWILCGIAAGKIAEGKGQGSGWYIGGFLLGVIAIIIVACLPDIRNNTQTQSVNSTKQISADKPVIWKCPKCGRDNTLDIKFCPECGEQYQPNYVIDDKGWICGKCNTLNESGNKFCKKCGADKESAEIEYDKKEAMNKYIQEHGKECGMCGNKALELYNVKIVDSMGTRFRKVCPDCLEKYNCTIIPEK